jgi:predicted nucleic acid-binding protein
MADVVLDANVLVGLLYAEDAHHTRARSLAARLESEGHRLILLDLLVYEAVSVLCRRAEERKTNPPSLAAVLDVVRRWFDQGQVRFVAQQAEQLVGQVLDVIAETAGKLNVNDALLVVLYREGIIDKVASFDPDFANVHGFPVVS